MKIKVLFLLTVFPLLYQAAFGEKESGFGQLSIRVLTEDNKPVKINVVQIWTKTAKGGRGYSFATRPAERLGTYRIEGIPIGKYYALKINKDAFAPFWKFEIEVSQYAQDVILCRLSKGCTIDGTVENEDGVPLANIPVVVNSPLCRRDVITDEKGHFVAGHLFQTNYSIIAEPTPSSFYKIGVHKGLVRCNSTNIKVVLKRKENHETINEHNVTHQKDTDKNSHKKLASASLQSRKIAEEALLNKPAPPLVIEKWHLMSFWDLNFKNKVILLDFWGVWCSPCKKGIPLLRNLHDNYSRKGLVIVGVHTPYKKELVQEFIAKNNLSYLVGIDCGGKTAELYHVSGYPTIYIIDQHGYVRAVNPKKDDIEKLIISLLGKSSNRSGKEDENDSSHMLK